RPPRGPQPAARGVLRELDPGRVAAVGELDLVLRLDPAGDEVVGLPVRGLGAGRVAGVQRERAVLRAGARVVVDVDGVGGVDVGLLFLVDGAEVLPGDLDRPRGAV